MQYTNILICLAVSAIYIAPSCSLAMRRVAGLLWFALAVATATFNRGAVMIYQFLLTVGAVITLLKGHDWTKAQRQLCIDIYWIGGGIIAFIWSIINLLEAIKNVPH